MGAGMLDDSPPIEKEAILLEIELFLHLDPRHAEERGEVGGHRVGQVERGGELARRSGIGRLRRNSRRDEGTGSFEEAAAGQGTAYRFLTSGNAHANLHG